MYTNMVKFTINRLSGSKVITTNRDTQKEYITSDDSMQRFWDFLFPGTRYFGTPEGLAEGFVTVDLNEQKAKEFELGLSRNPFIGGSRRRRALRKYNKSNRMYRKKSRTTRRR